MPSPLTASWIWHRQSNYTPYHQVIAARKIFRINKTSAATLKIAADGSYRLFVNKVWVSDGPARSWPEHFTYDELDVSGYLQPGNNEIVVIARHWQVGEFHTRPQQAGLWVQIDFKLNNGRTRQIITDESWQTAWLPAWLVNTPKVSIQMEPHEQVDARLSVAGPDYHPAAVLFAAQDGPWQDLRPRDVALLARRPRALRRFLGGNLVQHRRDLHFCLPVARLAHPTALEANRNSAASGGMWSQLELAAPGEIELRQDGFLTSVDGQVSPDGRYTLAAGSHTLAAFAWPLYSHQKERSLRLLLPESGGTRLVNPLDRQQVNPWVWLSLPRFEISENDMVWDWFQTESTPLGENISAYYTALNALLADPTRLPEFGGKALQRSVEEMFVIDAYWLFPARAVLGSADAWITHPTALMHDNSELTRVEIPSGGDVELVYDLGEQTIGYFEFELTAPAGVAVDIAAVEYINPQGRVQHTGDNRNSLRYITHEGKNHFISLKRRAGRYLFITLRCGLPGCSSEPAAVELRLVRMIETTYPVEHRSGFACSDASLERIWQISARTLELCMEDTFTDCPLYEQTYWVGDARNESLFAYDAFGTIDIARRCLRLAAESLERYPLVGGQVPSSWDMLLPAWSFLWGIAVWDHYFYTGDRTVLTEYWPAVVRNLQGAEQHLDRHGLFSGPFWNMFDWSGIDDRHETVLHNSLLWVGALEAAQKMAVILEDAPRTHWLAALRARLSAAINRWWDPTRQGYPDSVLADGSPSPSSCQHTSFLAYLYDVIPSENSGAALGNMLNPPAGMVTVGSPFAMLYLYEALAKAGQPAAILKSIYDNYLPMLRAGATTVWEVFPSSAARPADFPTRSHTHAWSSAPVHFLPQVVLGIHATAPGGTAYNISPWLGELSWAEGSICTARGLLCVSWQRSASQLQVTVHAPNGTRVTFEPNSSLAGLEVTVLGLS